MVRLNRRTTSVMAGLAVAFAECAFGPANVGADVRLTPISHRSFCCSTRGRLRILVSTATPERVFASAKRNGVEALDIGVTLESRVVIRNKNQILIDSHVAELKNLWETALEHLLQNPVMV